MKKLYYISQGKTSEEHLKNIKNVCENGVQTIQLRIKNSSFDEYLKTALKAKNICDKYNAKLIINDSIEVAKKTGAGVHLGKEDESIKIAKNKLKDCTIGGTANTLNDCLELINKKVDYIGLGPFRFTNTKKNLNPILGLKGYKAILKELNKKGYKTPIYAIGGITENDFKELFDTGIYGIAVSGLLSDIKGKRVKEIVQKIKG